MSRYDDFKKEAERLGIPLVEPIRSAPGPHEPVAICGQCGLQIMRVMGYVCPHARCPTGLGSATSLSI